jgi:threonyl-tRNA synthetase
MGEPVLWDEAEAALERALNANNIPFIVNHGDGAFYGPKIDFDVIDALGRKWQCATIQLDFQLPRRFELTYTDRENTQKTPIVIHRAIFGSLERFIGILIEHVAGAFPTWLAPVQAVIMPISDEQVDYCHAVAARFRAKGLRVEVDDRNEKLGYKVREAELLKTPYMLVAGRREAEGNSFSVRNFSVGDRGAISVDEIEAELLHKVANREFDVKLKTISWSHEEETETDESGY